MLSSPVYSKDITGIVLSAKDSVVLAGAECRMYDDTKFITGTATGGDGSFLINTDWKEAAKLEISLQGYDTTTILIENGAHNLNIGQIYLDDSITLGEVTVTSNAVNFSKGRTIVYPSGSDVKASSTALSLFQKLPLAGLEANPITRSLAVDGGTPVILINGVPSSLSDFNSLQAKDIEKVEYSRFTPARYADSNGRGFISITLKKRNDGGQVYLWGRSAVNTAFVDADILASYHQGPSQFSLSYSPSWRNYQDVFDNVTESYIGNDFRVNIEQHDRNPFWYHTHGMKLKYNYSPSLKTLFSATFNATPFSTKRRSIADANDSELGEYFIDSYAKSIEFTPSLDLFLRHDFNDKNSLEAQVVGTLSSSDYRRDNKYGYFDDTEDSYIMNVDTRRRSLISEISYIHSFNSEIELSAGYQNTVSHSTNKYLTTDYEPILTENNNYIYTRLGWSLNRVYLSLSTGAKLFWTKNDEIKRHFIRNLSTAQLSWNISRAWNLSAAFQYSPSIPSLSSLTDYPQQVSPYLISNGNPDLKVSDIFFTQLVPSFSYKKFTASLRMNYYVMNNYTMSDVRYLGDGLFLSQSINAKHYREMSARLSLKISGFAGFGANLNLGFTHSQDMGEDWKNNLNAFDASMTLWWNKDHFTISYWRKIPGKYLSGHVVGKYENGDALQIEYKPDNYWTIGASWMYMFDKKGTRYPSWNYSQVNPGHTDRYIENNSNMIVLSVSYTADFGSIFRTARRNLNNSDKGSSLLKM